MKVTLIKALVVGTILSGCAQTQTPYKVVKVIDHETRLLPIQFSVGITQERLGEKKYRITAKLAEFGTYERAFSMALYHASLLAEQQGDDAFIMNNIRRASWCQNSINKKTRFISSYGGPTAKLIITLVKAEKADHSNQLFLAQRTKVLNKALIDEVPTKLELEQVSAERLEHCNRRASKRQFGR